MGVRGDKGVRGGLGSRGRRGKQGCQGRQGSLGTIRDYDILFIFRDSLHGELTVFSIIRLWFKGARN